ncbi:hypothetical protein [Tsukamurella sp. 1534]|nr:hypothetical protein [Tsukamurella sp. 1534]
MTDTDPIPSADPADVQEQATVIDLAAAIEDYPWVRRDEVLTVAGRTFLL